MKNFSEIIDNIKIRFSWNYWKEIYENKIFPKDFFSTLGEYNLYGILVKKEFGGYGLTLKELVELTYQISKIVGTPSYLLLSHNIVSKLIEEFGNKYLKEELLEGIIKGKYLVSMAANEEACGNDIFCIKTTAVEKDNKFIINGIKDYVTNADIADIFLIVTRTANSNKKSYGLTVFTVKSSEIRYNISLKKLNKMGLDFLSLCSVKFSNVEVSKENVLGEVNEGWRILKFAFNLDKILLAAALIGTAEKVLYEAVEYAKIREVFGKQIGSFQGIQFPLAEGYVELLASKSLLNELAENLANKDYSNLDDDQILSNILATYYHAVMNSYKIADIALQTLAAKGYTESMIEKYYRDIRYYRIGPLSTELILASIATRGLKLPRSY